MYWKTPPNTGKFQVGFALDPKDQRHIDVMPVGMTDAQVTLASCDMNALHGQFAWKVSDPAPESLTAGGFTYHLHRSEILKRLINHVYLRDEGDAPPKSVQATIDFQAAMDAKAPFNATLIAMQSQVDLDAQKAEAIQVSVAVTADPQFVVKKSLVQQALAFVGLSS